ncbi:MAG: hypothetical protein RO257_09730 [Candidatus Kapabacteria bacterium]|jgi:prephenate dehydrogenase|nr:hypothetical protein [Candidatus Kapabacteria bacterium]
MKTEIIKDKENLEVVNQLRKIRDKINDDIKNLSPQELIDYFKRQKSIFSEKEWHN